MPSNISVTFHENLIQAAARGETLRHFLSSSSVDSSSTLSQYTCYVDSSF